MTSPVCCTASGNTPSVLFAAFCTSVAAISRLVSSENVHVIVTVPLFVLCELM